MLINLVDVPNERVCSSVEYPSLLSSLVLLVLLVLLLLIPPLQAVWG